PCATAGETNAGATTRAFFRSDGSPTPAYMGDFGGKAHGNLFGDGFGFSSAGADFPCEIPELLAVSGGNSDMPVVQLLNNDGSRNTGAGGPVVAGSLTYTNADTAP